MKRAAASLLIPKTSATLSGVASARSRTVAIPALDNCSCSMLPRPGSAVTSFSGCTIPNSVGKMVGNVGKVAVGKSVGSVIVKVGIVAVGKVVGNVTVRVGKVVGNVTVGVGNVVGNVTVMVGTVGCVGDVAPTPNWPDVPPTKKRCKVRLYTPHANGNPAIRWLPKPGESAGITETR